MRQRRRNRSKLSHLAFANVNQKMMMVFAVFSLILMLLITETKQEQKKDEPMHPPGNIMVEIRWPDKADDDIDLWVMSPEDKKPVGYSHKSDKIFSLLRDDLGMSQDATDLNYEMAYGRGLPAGEYVVNLHYYRHGSTLTEVPVEVIISVQKPGDDNLKQILKRRVVLNDSGQEVTVVRFELDDKGELNQSTVNDIFMELRVWTTQSP